MADDPKTTITQLDSDTDIGGRSNWGNMLVVNTGEHPVINFSFMLRVEGVFDLPCKAVKGIRRENEFDYIQEGGLNDYVHLKRKAISKPFTFQVERYVGVNWIDPMPLGTELTLPLILFVNTRCFPAFKPARNYVFTGCTVIAKDYGEMNAEVSGLLLETVTIAYREMVCLDIPAEALESDAWKFDGKKREGEGDRHYNSNLFNKEWESTYNSKSQMEERAEKARWSLTVKDGKPQSMYGKNYESYVKDINAEIQKEIDAAETPEEKAEAEAKKIVMSPAAARKWSLTIKDGKPQSMYGKNYESYVNNMNAEIQKEIDAAETEEEKKAAEEKKIVMSPAAARKYVHSETAKKYSSAKHHDGETELSQEKMEENAKKWSLTLKDGKPQSKYGKNYESYVNNINAKIQEEIDKTEEGSKERAEAEAKKIAMSPAAARKYEHSETAKQYSSAKHHDGETELSQEKMEENAKKWSLTLKDGKPQSKYGKNYESYVNDMNEAIQAEIDAAKTPEEKAKAEAKKIAMSSSAARKYEHSKTAKQYSSAKHHDGETELSVEKMEANAKLYQHSKTPGKYVGAKHNEKEASKSAMEGKAKLYKHSKQAGKYAGAKHNEKEASKSAMEGKAKLYKHSKTPGNYVGAKHNDEEASKSAMEGKAKLYQHSKQAGKYAGAKHNEKEASKSAMEGKAKKYKHSSQAGKYAGAKHNGKEASRSAMEGKAKQYQHSSQAGKYVGAKHNDEEASRKTFEDRARLWPRTRSAKQITDFLKNH